MSFFDCLDRDEGARRAYLLDHSERRRLAVMLVHRRDPLLRWERAVCGWSATDGTAGRLSSDPAEVTCEECRAS